MSNHERVVSWFTCSLERINHHPLRNLKRYPFQARHTDLELIHVESAAKADLRVVLYSIGQSSRTKRFHGREKVTRDLGANVGSVTRSQKPSSVDGGYEDGNVE